MLQEFRLEMNAIREELEAEMNEALDSIVMACLRGFVATCVEGRDRERKDDR